MTKTVTVDSWLCGYLRRGSLRPASRLKVSKRRAQVGEVCTALSEVVPGCLCERRLAQGGPRVKAGFPKTGSAPQWLRDLSNAPSSQAP
jgi:hypothetical protein